MSTFPPPSLLAPSELATTPGLNMSPELKPHPEIARAVRALYGPGDVVELRAFSKTGSPRVGRFAFGTNGQDLALAIAAENESGRSVYFVGNRHALPAVAMGFNSGVKIEDVTRRVWVLLDFDPVRTDGIATESQHNTALAQGYAARDFLVAEGWSRTALVVADSGNGCHVLIAVDLANSETVKQLVKNVQLAIAARFSIPKVVNVECFCDSNRILRAYGSVNYKGEETGILKWRRSRIIEAEITPPQAITREQLEDFVAKYPSKPTERAEPQRSTTTDNETGSFTYERLKEKLDAWVEQRPGFDFKAGSTSKGRGFHITCPGALGGWPDGTEHSGGGSELTSTTVVWVGDGFPRFSCKHAHCDGGGTEPKKTWGDLQKFFGTKLSFGDVAVNTASPAASKPLVETIVDAANDEPEVPVVEEQRPCSLN